MDVQKQLEILINELGLHCRGSLNERSEQFNLDSYLTHMELFIRKTNIVCSKDEIDNYLSDKYFILLFNKTFSEKLLLYNDFLKFQDFCKSYPSFKFDTNTFSMVKYFIWILIWLLQEVDRFYNIIELVRVEEVEIFYFCEKGSQTFNISKFCVDKDFHYKELFIILLCVTCGGQFYTKDTKSASLAFAQFRCSSYILNLFTILYHNLFISFQKERIYVQVPYYSKQLLKNLLEEEKGNYEIIFIFNFFIFLLWDMRTTS
jgi:hypothetical protein